MSYLLMDLEQFLDQDWTTYFKKHNKNEKSETNIYLKSSSITSCVYIDIYKVVDKHFIQYF